jgi:hypothetical protein
MKSNQLLGAAVRAWVSAEFPTEGEMAKRAASLAANCYARTSSVSEAHKQARGFVGSWMRHPSHSRDHGVPLRLVS